MATKNPKVDDVITSKDFAYGYYHFAEPNYIFVDGHTTSLIAENTISEDDRLAMAAKFGKVPPKYVNVDYGAYEEDRGKAEFVVEHAKMEGGDERNSIPDGLHILARRLNPDGSYDKDGEVIDFYLDNNHGCQIPLESITIKRKMKKKFV